MSDPKFWVAVSFVLFFVLLGRKIWTALTSALDGRAAQISASLAEAANLRAEAEAMLRQAEAERTTAQRDAAALIARAKDEAERVAASAAAEAEAAAHRRERMAMGRIAAAEASAVADVRNAATDIAIAAARTLMAEGVTASVDVGLIDASVAELPKSIRAA